jgi:TP901 family phage tail tape measure protein
MDNISVVVGIELDKSQFNEKHIQGQLDKVSENINLNLKKVKIGDISRELQSDLNKQTSNLEIQIKDVVMDKSLIDDFVVHAQNLLKDIKISDAIDEKDIKSKIRNSIKEAFKDVGDLLKINFKSISVRGLKASLEKLSQDLSNGIEIKPLVHMGEINELRSTVRDLKGDIEDLAKVNFRNLEKLDSNLKRVKPTRDIQKGVKSEVVESSPTVTESITKTSVVDDDIFSDIERLSDDVTDATGKMYDLSFAVNEIRNKYKEYGQEIEKVKDAYKIQNKEALDHIDEIENAYDTDVFKKIVEYQKELNDVVEEYRVSPVRLEQLAKTYESWDGSTGVRQWEQYMDEVNLSAKKFEELVARSKYLDQRRRELENNIKNNLYNNKKVATEGEAIVFQSLQQAYKNLPKLDLSSVQFGVREDLTKLFDNELFRIDISDLDLRFEDDLKEAYRRLEQIVKSYTDEYVAKFKGNESFKDFGNLFGDMDIDTDKVKTSVKEVGNELDKIQDVAPKGEIVKFDGAISGSKELSDRLNEIKKSSMEISDISYKFDVNDDLKSAIITYKNEAGQVLREFMGWETVLDKAGNEVDVFTTKSVGAKETFIDINKETSKLEKKIKDIKDNDLVDETNIIELESGIKNLRENVDKLSTEEVRKELDLLYEKFDATQTIDKFLVKLDNARNIKMEMGLDVSGLDDLEKRIKAINVDTPIKDVRLLFREIQRIGSGNSTIIGLQGVIDKAEDSLRKFAETGDRVSFDKLNNSIAKSRELIDKLGKGTIISATEVRVLRDSVRDVTRELNALNSKKLKLNLKLDNLAEDGKIGARELENLRKQIDSMDTSNVNTMFNQLSREINKVTKEANSATSIFSNLGSSINRGIQTAFGFEFMDIVTDQLMQLKDNIVEIDTAMVGLQRVSTGTSETYDEIAASANQTAMAMGRTTQEVITATTEFVKMGNSVQESTDVLANAGLILANVAEMGIEDAVNAMSSTMKGMGLAAEDANRIVDVINEAGNKFALNSSDLAEGLRVGSASLSIAGNSLEEASALIVAGTEIMQDPTRIANGLKTLSMRLRGVAQEGEKLNPELGDLIENLVGVSLVYTSGELEGEFRSTYEIIRDIAKEWDNLNSQEQALLLEEVAGKEQAATLSAILQNAETLTEAYDKLGDAAGSAADEQAAYMDSVAGKANALRENFMGIFYDLVDSDAVKGMLDTTNMLLSAYRNIASAFGELPTLLATVTGAFTIFSSKGREMAQNLTDVAAAVGQQLPGGLGRVGASLENLTGKLTVNSAKQKENMAHSKAQISLLREKMVAFEGNAKVTSQLTAGVQKHSAALTTATKSLVATKVATVALNTAMSMGLSFAISGAISLLGKMFSSVDETSSKVKELSGVIDSMDDNEKLFEQYRQANQELEGLNENSERAKELNQQINDIRSQLAGIDDEAYAILNNQNLSYEEQLDLLKSINDQKMREYALDLQKEMQSGFFSESVEQEAVRTKEVLENTLSSYKELQEAMAEPNANGTVQIGSMAVSYEEASEKAKEYEDTLRSGMNTLGVYASNSELLRTVLGKVDLKTVELDESTQNAIETILKTGDASEDAKGGLSELEQGLDDVGSTATNTEDAIKSLTNAFSGMNKPIELLKTMREEFGKFGGLTDETYTKVLESGDSRLIALLANETDFMKNSNELYKSLVEERAGYAEELIKTSAGQYEGSITQEFNIDTILAENNLKDIGELAKVTSEGITESFDNVDTSGISDGIKDIFEGMSEDSSEISEILTNNMKQYYDNVNSMASDSANQIMSYEEAKAQASEMWKNKEIIDMAQMVLSNQNAYNEDLINWADAVVNKKTEGMTFSKEVLQQVSDLITNSGLLYSDDVTNWGIALGEKDANQVRFINAIIQSFAEMVVKNKKAYSDDIINWAEAVLNKENRNKSGVDTIGNAFSSLFGQLSGMYGTDAQNFANATNSKLNNLKNLWSSYQNVQNKIAEGFSDKNLQVGVVNQDRLNALKPFGGALEQVGPTQDKADILFKPVGGVNISNVDSSYVGSKPNYVGSVGSSGSGGNKGSSSSAKKDVDNLEIEDLVDRYYDVNNALQKVENQLEALDTELESATGKDRIALLEKEIKLLNDKRTALINVRSEQQEELAELRKILANSGFGFAADGSITNYETRLTQLTNAANKKTGEAKEKAIANVKEVAEQLEKYTDLLLEKIPDTTNQINGIGGAISDIREEIDQLIEDTTFFTKDFVDRYYEVNNALKQVENQLNKIGVAMENASDNRLVELLDKQIQLYIEQGKALAEIRRENVEELNELGRELYDAGFQFNMDDGTLKNYESYIDKLVQNANKITDGKKQEKEIERIEKLVETIEKYTDLLLSDIPEITNDMDDLANAVIDSQKEIADILAKQRDEYIENLEKETEALRKEVERRQEILQKQWEQEDAEDELYEKQQALNELEDQLTVALRVGDEELVKNIREQISNAQKEINDFIRDQERDYITERFDEDLEKIDEDLENRIEEINEKLSDEEILNLVAGGVRDLTEVLNNIENGTRGVRSAFAAIGATISETWINSLDTFMEKLDTLSNINLGLNIESKLAKAIGGFERVFNINQGDLVVQGNITEDILPVVQNMIDSANNSLINDINMAFSR